MGKKLLKLFWIKVVAAVVLIVIGILTITFAILELMGRPVGVDPTFPIRIVIGIALSVFGVVELIIGLTKNEEHTSIKEAITGAAIAGVGVFLFLNEAKIILDDLVGYLLPIIVACCGFAVAIKGVVEACQKVPGKKWLVLIIVGVIIGTLGTVFVIFNEKLSKVIWLILGIAIALGGVADLLLVVNSYRTGKKAVKKVEEKVENKSEEIAQVKEAIAEKVEEIKEIKAEKPIEESKEEKIEKAVKVAKAVKAVKAEKPAKTTKAKKTVKK